MKHGSSILEEIIDDQSQQLVQYQLFSCKTRDGATTCEKVFDLFDFSSHVGLSEAWRTRDFENPQRTLLKIRLAPPNDFSDRTSLFLVDNSPSCLTSTRLPPTRLRARTPRRSRPALPMLSTSSRTTSRTCAPLCAPCSSSLPAR